MVAEILARNGLTQAELARRAGMPRSVVNAYVKGTRRPGEEALRRLATAGGFELRLVPRQPPANAAEVGRRLAGVEAPIGKLIRIHESLTGAGLPHAFGGSIALAYFTQEPRGTGDLDLNIFVAPSRAEEALAGLPSEVRVEMDDIATIASEGEGRVLLGETPIDIFLNTLPLHEVMAERLRWVPLAGRDIPIVDGASLVVFKVLIDRPKDWADIGAIARHDRQDIELASATLSELLDRDDYRLARLRR